MSTINKHMAIVKRSMGRTEEIACSKCSVVNGSSLRNIASRPLTKFRVESRNESQMIFESHLEPIESTIGTYHTKGSRLGLFHILHRSGATDSQHHRFSHFGLKVFQDYNPKHLRAILLHLSFIRLHLGSILIHSVPPDGIYMLFRVLEQMPQFSLIYI